jgi:hypothetical protein
MPYQMRGTHMGQRDFCQKSTKDPEQRCSLIPKFDKQNGRNYIDFFLVEKRETMTTINKNKFETLNPNIGKQTRSGTTIL